MTKRKNVKPTSQWSTLKTLGVITSLGLSGLFYNHMTKPADVSVAPQKEDVTINTFAPIFDNSVSPYLLEARKNTKKRQAYLDTLVTHLRGVDQLRYLGHITYDPDGSAFEDFLNSIAQALSSSGRKIVLSNPYDRLPDLLTASKWRGIRQNAQDDIVCFVAGNNFELEKFTDNDFLSCLADHEDIHAKVHLKGYLTPFASGSDYLKMTNKEPAIASTVSTVEELVAYHHQLIQIVTGKRIVSERSYEIWAKQYGKFREIAQVADLQPGIMRSIVEYTLRETSNLIPTPEKPFLRLVPRQ